MGEKTLLQKDDCLQTGDGIPLQGRVVILHPSALPEIYRDADNQLYFCTGGNDSDSNTIEHSVFTVSLGDGRPVRLSRNDILGIAKPEILSEQARLQLSKIRPVGSLDLKKYEPQYSGYCFLPSGRYTSATWLCNLGEVENYIDMQKDYQYRIMICDRDDFCVFEMVEGEILYPTREMIDAQNASQEKGGMEFKP